MGAINFESAVERFRLNGDDLSPRTYRFSIPDAKLNLWRGLQYFCNKDNPTWMPEYDKVVEYLTDNKGKGLFLFGKCGTGKTVITKKILPVLMNQFCKLDGCNIVPSIYDAVQMHERLVEIKSKMFVVIDDVGTESSTYNSYGNVTCPLAEILDNAEKQGKFVVMSSNMNLGDDKAFIKRYGQRTYDRLKSVFCCIAFNGESQRA